MSVEKKEIDTSEKREFTELKLESTDSLNHDIEIVIKLILQEQNCPNILEYQEELVKSLSEAINTQEASLNDLPKESQDNKFFIDLYKLDLEKVKYLLKTYFKVRILKIQKHSDFIQKENLKHKLSQQEREFTKRYNQIRTNYMKEIFLKKISSQFNDLGLSDETKKTVRAPEMNQFVFMKVMKKITSEEDPRLEREINEESILLGNYERFV